jgi:hypothetical protein
MVLALTGPCTTGVLKELKRATVLRAASRTSFYYVHQLGAKDKERKAPQEPQTLFSCCGRAKP